MRLLPAAVLIMNACGPAAPLAPTVEARPTAGPLDAGSAEPNDEAFRAASPDTTFARARERVMAGDDQAALAMLRRRVDEAPQDVDCWLLLSQLHAAHDAYDASLRVLDAASCGVEDGRRWEVSLERGRVLFQLELSEEALEALEPVRSLDPYQKAGDALHGQLSRDLYFWTAAWIHAHRGNRAMASQFSKAYLAITCRGRTGPDCDDIRLVADCGSDDSCVLGRIPVENLTGTGAVDTTIHGCDRARLPDTVIENIEPPTGAMARLADLQRRFRLPALGEAARSGKTVNVLGSVRTTTVVSAGPASASHYAVTVLGLVSPGSMTDAMQPTMNPAIDATLAKLSEGRTMRFVDGRVRIAQPYPGGVFVSPRYGVFVPQQVLSVR